MTSLRYPRDLANAESHGDYVSFTFYQYKPPFSGGSSSTAYTSSVQAYNDEANYTIDSELSAINIYMPEDISTNSSAGWGGRDFSPLGAAALKSFGPMTQNVAEVKNGIGSFVSRLKNDVAPQMYSFIAGEAAAAALNSIPGFGGGVTANDVLSSTQGRILNPNTEVLYSGPQLRTFGLNFKLRARDANESKDIRKICNTFRKAALPVLDSTGSAGGSTPNLIGVPRIVKVKFKQKGSDVNKWITQYKMCAIGSVDVNYTPDGVWATYSDGSPVAVGLTLQFQELKILYGEEVNVDGGGY
jgi:hypothetical protein